MSQAAMFHNDRYPMFHKSQQHFSWTGDRDCHGTLITYVWRDSFIIMLSLTKVRYS